jgi:CheY-like chemotaxis protein
MDVQMPVMDGIAATRSIRALAGPVASVPVIAMTANVFAEQIASFRDAGMNDHIGKPFQRDELFAIIARWLPRKPAAKKQST